VKDPGHVALVPFPRVDLSPGKPRPVLPIAEVPGPYDDWLVCMVPTRLDQRVEGFDELVAADASDYEQSGLKAPSVIRVGRLAVVSDEMLLGCIGTISDERLDRIRKCLASWIQACT